MQLPMCAWLLEQGCPWGKALAKAARSGQLDACQWLLDNGCPWDEKAVREAARGGHTDLLQWLLAYEQPSFIDHSRIIAAAAEGFDMKGLKQVHALWSDRATGAWTEVLSSAAASPTPDWRAKVLYYEAQSFPPCAEATARAATCPDAAERLPWLRQRGYPVKPEVLTTLGKRGDLEALRYLMSVMNFDSAALDAAEVAAASAGQLAALRQLWGDRDDREPALCMHAAARGGHLATFVWLVESEWAARGVLESAAGRGERESLLQQFAADASRSGSVALLAWMRERGCGFDGYDFACAAGSGCAEALEWLAEGGCSMGTGGDAYVAAAHNADLAALRVLRRLSCPWGPAGNVFARCIRATHVSGGKVLSSGRCSRHILEWLVDSGCPISWKPALALAQKGSPLHERLLKLRQRQEGANPPQPQQEPPQQEPQQQGHDGGSSP